MPQSALPILMLALAAPAATTTTLDGPRPGSVSMAQVIIREHIIVRVPRMAEPPPFAGELAMAAPPVRWKEKKGPKCIAAANMAGAMVTTVRQVDLVLRGGKRVRARLGGACKPLDFYSGFYLRPAGDGMICADRDAIRTQSGTSCPIDRFNTLVAAR